MEVLDNYPREKMNPLKNNFFAALMQDGLNNSIDNLFLGTRYKTKGSAGIGHWATIPWIGVFDTSITTKASDGFYIAYLFSKSSNIAYLSLIQSWTMYKNKFSLKIARKNITNITKYLQNTLNTESSSMNADTINLMDDGSKITELPKGYELGTILNIKYFKNSLPDNSTMMKDLNEMITIYRELKSKLVSSDNSTNVDFFISEYNKYKKIQTNEDSRFSIDDSVTENHNSIVRQTNFEDLNNKNSELGFIGEKQVLEMEKERLSYYPKLQEKVEQVSVTIGDGLGYDIKSFRPDGTELYIEVKTTASGKNQPFNITTNEIEFSKDNADNYKLTRLYDFKFNGSESIEFKKYELNGSLVNNHNLLLKPSTYKVKLLNNDSNIIY
ncbi:MrcB family domain-containing protein [Companilactobacillus keshanensis]|nr:DUF3578 domain-containing protein [Companilactobacillus keshanensis]